jgi:tubulin-specific chaperone E
VSHEAVMSNFYIGKRLSFGGDLCTVRYIGAVSGTKGEWLGVEWDGQLRGKHSGEANGVKYFECRHLMFVLAKIPT